MTKRTDEETWVAACEDLLNWEEEEHALLPGGMTEQEIADLVTGEVRPLAEVEL